MGDLRASEEIEAEMEACGEGEIPCGVISDKPAYLMNAEAEGQAVALVGKVKCKVHGVVAKGDLLTTCGTHPGCAQKAISPVLGSIVGKAMESKDDAGESVILISVGRL